MSFLPDLSGLKFEVIGTCALCGGEATTSYRRLLGPNEHGPVIKFCQKDFNRIMAETKEYVFVSANSHRSRERLLDWIKNVDLFYRGLASKNKGPHYAYRISLEDFASLKENPIKGVGKLRHQDESEWRPCINFE